MSFGNIFIIIMTFFCSVHLYWFNLVALSFSFITEWRTLKQTKKKKEIKHRNMILLFYMSFQPKTLVYWFHCSNVFVLLFIRSLSQRQTCFPKKKNMKKKWFFYHFYVIVYHLHHRWYRNDIDAGQKYEFLSLLFACLVVIFETKSGSKRTNQIIIM